MGQVADTSLRSLEQEEKNLRFPLWLQRYLFFRKARGVHGVHSPLAFRLATDVFMKAGETPLETRLKNALPHFSFQSISLIELEDELSFWEKNGDHALWINNIHINRAPWLSACADPRVTLAIDCFSCGLLLRTAAVKEKQYLRQRKAR